MQLSQMRRRVAVKNKSFFTTFIGVLAATLFFYGVSAGGAFAFNNLFSPKNSFGHQSYVGTFDVSKLKKEEAKGLLSASFHELEEKFHVELVYQDVTAKLPVEAITYELDRTTELAKTGRENAIRSTVKEDALRTVLNQQFSTVDFSDHDVTDIARGIEKELESGIMPAKVHINDLMESTAFAKSEVALASLNVSALSESIDELIRALNDTEIAPFSTFSLLDFVEGQGVGFISNETLTIVGSVLYMAVLQTNFAVDERYIGEVLHPDVPIGYEASVNGVLGIDFIFTNPNKSSFTLKMKRDGQQVSASMTGLPFIYTYETVVGPVSLFKPRTIEQFSAMLSRNSKKVKQEGANGQEVTVVGTVFNGGIEISHGTISTDFYAPIPRIEILPLIQDDVPGTDADSSGVSGSVSDNTDDSGADDEKSDDKSYTDKSGIKYDKGGNVIH